MSVHMIDFSEMIIPTLKILYDSKKMMTIKDINKELIKVLDINENMVSEKHTNTNQSEFAYRAAWARTYLKKYGIIQNPERAKWMVNEIYGGEELIAIDIVNAVRNNQTYVNPTKILPEIDLAVNNKKLLDALTVSYKKGKVVLFTGAGVSMAANFPSWETLVARFLISRFQEESKHCKEEDKLKELIEIEKLNRECSYIAQTRLIMQNIEPEKYLELLKKALYYEDDKINLDNGLFNAIIRLIRNSGNNPKIKDIVTFNFDDLLERKLEQSNIYYDSFTTYGEKNEENNLGVYHVHGYLGKDSNPDEIDLDDIIFSEEQYHKMYNDVYHWSNLKQINYLRENTCLFIGCSLTDPNMRRLLDIARMDNEVKHFAILKKEDICVPKNIENDSEAYIQYQNFNIQNRNSYFNSLGIHVVWVSEFVEIPNILDTIIKNGIEN